MKMLLSYSLILTLFACYSCSDRGYEIRTSSLVVSLSANGEINSLTVNGKKFEKPVSAFTTIAGCRQEGATIANKTDDGAICFERTLRHDSLQKSCVLIDKFIPVSTGIRWELTVKGTNEPWGSIIQTRIQYPVSKSTLFWTPWGVPQYDPSSLDIHTAKSLKAYPGKSAMQYFNEKNNFWMDPLVSVPFSEVTYYYGALYFGIEKGKERTGYAGCVPVEGKLFCIPMATVIEPESGVGLTFALSPEDEIIDLTMNTSAQGDIVFNRLFNRISSDHARLFSMDITVHADDWRPALAWMSNRYPEYFNPVNPQAHILGGTGAYSNHYSDFDTEKMEKMCFTVNWQASFDFPYMGMFLPPVGSDESWTSFSFDSWGQKASPVPLTRGSITIKAMSHYAAEMKAKGFYVLNYFNVTEFGTGIKYPPAPVQSGKDDEELWKDANNFLYTKLADAILPLPDALSDRRYIGATPPQPWGSWEGSIVMDPGEPGYRDFLLDQARRHVREIPDAFGICIDRLDWLRMFNERADDGIAWFDEKPVRSLITSWKNLMEDFGPIFHTEEKSILVNNHLKRIDLLNHVDGIFDEFTYGGVPLNTTAFLCINKPALGWTDGVETIKKEGGDTFFQKYLYMGVFPMCPFPGNDHSIRPDAEIDQLYLDYGLLMKLMQNRQWVLEPHAVSVENNLAKANMFKIPDGYSIPVVYGEGDKLRVKIAKIKGLTKQNICEAYHPGKESPVRLELGKNSDGWFLDVPLERGCAMIKLITR